MKATAKLHCVIWILVLGSFSFLQFNDPDPLPWSLVYFLCGLLWLAELFDRRNIWILYLSSLGLTFWMGLLAQAPIDLFNLGTAKDLFAEMSPGKPYIEASREFLGLGICVLSLLILFAKTQSNPTEKGKF